MSRAISAALAAALLFAAGCRTGKALIDTSDGNDAARGTIGGILQASGGGDALGGRRVHAVDIRTRARYSAVTNVAGGFSIQVPPGKYRLDVELREGESVVRDPGTIDIGASDLDSDIQVEVGRAGGL